MVLNDYCIKTKAVIGLLPKTEPGAALSYRNANSGTNIFLCDMVQKKKFWKKAVLIR